MSSQPYPGYEGSVGPFPGEYGRMHVYARDIYSGAGNCVCGRDPRHQLHPEVAPGFPNPEIQPGGVLDIKVSLTDEEVAELGRRFEEASASHRIRVIDHAGNTVEYW